MIQRSRALRHLVDILKIEGLSGEETAIARAVTKKLRDAGCKASWIRHDDAHKRTGLGASGKPFEIGNLIVEIPGTALGPRLLFSSHLDTVPLCRGAKPVRRKADTRKKLPDRIVSSDAKTALGADNRTAVGVLITLAETLLSKKLPHPPLTLLFTVGEEIGLRGSRQIKLSDLGKPRPKLGFNIDAGAPATFVIGATGADRWTADVYGVSSHAGVHPEDGVSATLIASRAIADVAEQGFFGKINQMGTKRYRTTSRKLIRTGTSNVGVIQGGEATNQVTDHVFIRGESRSHHPSFLDRITNVYRKAFEKAARSVKNRAGERGRVVFEAERDYPSFEMSEGSPAVEHAMAAAESINLPTGTVIANGGLDANWLNEKGIPTVTFGAGQHNAHTIREYADVEEYLGGCALAVAIATRTD